MAYVAERRKSNTLLKGFLIGGALLLGYRVFAKGASAASLNFIPGRIKGLYFDGITPYLTVGVVVQNTSNYAFILRSIAGSVVSNQNGQTYSLGSVSYFNTQKIFPNSQVEIFVNLRFSLIGIVSDIINSISNGFSQVIEMKAIANIEQVQVPIHFKYNVVL